MTAHEANDLNDLITGLVMAARSHQQAMVDVETAHKAEEAAGHVLGVARNALREYMEAFAMRHPGAAP